MKDVSRLSGVPYGTVNTILRRFRKGEISLEHNPKKPGPKELFNSEHKEYLKYLIDNDS